MNWSNSVCLITGASSGIGEAIARQLNQLGVRLILVGRRERALEKLVDDLGEQHRLLMADISSVEGRERIVAEIQNNESIDLIIQCAGYANFGELSGQELDQTQRTLDTNLSAPIAITQAALPALLKRSQVTLVYVGSAFGSIGYPCYASYCASKFGLRGFSEALARELDGSPVSVRYLAPRATDTEFNSVAIKAMNKELGNSVDSPDRVAKELLELLSGTARRRVVGWPEKLFARLNGVLPEMVDKAIAKQLNTIRSYSRTQLAQGENS